MEQIKINVTLNGETRPVDACVFHPSVYVYRIAMVTSHGEKTHLGTIAFKYVEGKSDYTDRDINYINYSGMRGNGNAKRSKFRYVGFPK